MIGSTMILVLTFAAATLLVVALAGICADVFLRDSIRRDRRLREAFRDAMRREAQESPLFRDLQLLLREDDLPVETLGRRVQTWIDQSGVRSTPMQLLVTGLIAMIPAFLCGDWLCGSRWAAIALAPAAAITPWVRISMLRAARRKRMCRQLPDVFDVMSRALRAGQSVQSAFQMIANEFTGPVAQEFSYCYEQQHLGMSTEVALRDLARRNSVMEVQIFAVGMIVSTRTGANLAELLLKLSTLIRNRLKLQSRLAALTAEGRMQAIVLSLLPFVVLGVLFATNRTYAQVLFDRPWLLIGCLASQSCGALWIRSLLRVEV